jgi:hypothetical protein
MKKNKKNGVRASGKIASDAAKILGNKGAASKLKSVAGSALVNRKK